VRRLALLVAGGALWLLLAAAPVFADGGPHQLTVNNGTAGISGDCAACHRAHTAQAESMLKEEVPGLCLLCHNGTGATTNVVDGFQYVPAGLSGEGNVMGGLRGGGFSYALIDSSHASRIFSPYPMANKGKVPVLADEAKALVTSTHGAAGGATVWGNGPTGTDTPGAGPVALTCVACHNPHGNGQYRILATTPSEEWTADGVPGWQTPPTSVEVTDTDNPLDLVRNYTVLPGSFAADVVTAGYSATQGDYWRRYVLDWRVAGSRDPMQTGWNGYTPTNAASNGVNPPNNSLGMMTAWCVQCHTRYSGIADIDSGLPPVLFSTGDAIYDYRHDTMNLGCLQCHVSHGSNAVMTPGTASADFPWPNDPPLGPGFGNDDSRLLKIDNRGTCQMCHDPTGTVSNGTYSGPTPEPGAP
jgi:predicted CXXCH cytochrome family protein